MNLFAFSARKRAWAEILLLLCLLIPLFFISIRDSHDWGGDFSMYIRQALNIARGVPQWENGYLFDPQNPVLGPPTYPPGFPILLSPVCLIWGNNMLAFSYYMTVLLVALLVVLFLLFRMHYGYLFSTCLTLVIAYNPWMLLFKLEVISDMPFTLFVALCMLLYFRRKNSWKWAVLIGFVVAFSMLIKSIGFVLLVAFWGDLALQWVREWKTTAWSARRRQFLFHFILSVSALFFYFFTNRVLFPVRVDTLAFYPTLFSADGLADTFARMAPYYVNEYMGVFRPNAGRWHFASLILQAFALAFTVLGFFRSVIKRPDGRAILVVGFLPVILAFPHMQGFRYLLPLLPVALLYMAEGIKATDWGITRYRSWLVLGFTLAILGLYRRDVTYLRQTQKEVAWGPMRPEAKAAFEYISRFTPRDAKFVFIKPRVLALYADRSALTNDPYWGIDRVEDQFQRFDPDYFLCTKDMENPALDSFMVHKPDGQYLVYQNERFTLYKRRQ